MKNIQEHFFNHSLLPPEPFLHNHMAGFVPPTVNIALHVKPQNNLNTNLIQLDDQPYMNKSISYSSSNSNSNDSYTNPFSEDSNSENSSLIIAQKSYTFKNSIENNNTDHLPEVVLNIQNNNGKMKTRSKSLGTNASSKSSNSSSTTSSSSNNRTSQQKKSNSGGRKPNSSQNVNFSFLVCMVNH